jgi:hypothetical protein
MIIPLAAKLLSGNAGPKVKSDWFMLAFVLWIIFTLVYHHGIGRFPYGVILAVEAFGGYLAGRVMIRSIDDYRRFIRYYMIVLLLLLPFAVYELFTANMLIANLFKGLFEVPPKRSEMRFDFYRVQVVFPHAILFGLFSSLTVASVYYLYKSRLSQLLPRLALSVSMTFMALSSAPIISAVLQVSIIFWGIITKEKWKLLVFLFALGFIFAEIFTNRGPIIIFIETFTLDPMSGWWRIHIWNYGSASVMEHPIFGIGLNLHKKPEWLTDSVDNFWLLMAMRHGLTGFLMLAIAIGLHIRAILKSNGLEPITQLARKGYMTTLVGVIFTLATVHIWGSLYVMVMFFIGAGSFIYTSPKEPETGQGDASSQNDTGLADRSELPLSRFSRVRNGAQRNDHRDRTYHRSLERR